MAMTGDTVLEEEQSSERARERDRDRVGGSDVVSPLLVDADKPYSEDWFWENTEPSFFEIGALNAPVQSQVCNGSWCRLELASDFFVEPGSKEENEFIADLVQAAGTELKIRHPEIFGKSVYFVTPVD